jgi:hypothetical protein
MIKEEKEIIPDQLNITIRTSIPGYQKIEYKPYMTLKDSDEKGVRFDPLIKLNESIINKIPQEYRIKQFFSIGLFKSLLNYNGGTPAKSLLQATRLGYVDNNIKITLNSIFPVNSVIYVGKNPYVIGDVQWTTGDWKIDLKQKQEEIDINKIRDPQLYTQLVKEEIISGEKQLETIPKNLLTGNNYTGPPVLIGLATGPPTTGLATGPPPVPTTVPTQVPTTTELVEKPKTLLPPPTKPQLQALPPPPTKPQLQALPPPPSKPQLQALPPPPSKPQLQALPPPPSKPQLQALPPPPEITKTPLSIENISEAEEINTIEEERKFNTLKETFKTSLNSTKFFISYFKNKSYFDIVNTIFSKLTYNEREKLNYFYQLVTNTKPTKAINLSPVMYKKLCDQVTILDSPNDGNCFFSAVSDGINIYNYENQNNKIIYKNYGNQQLFTISVIREIVLRYIEELPQNRIQEFIDFGGTYSLLLNDAFENALQQSNIQIDTDEEYMDKLNYIYAMSEDNFFVYKPIIPPIDIDERRRPFRAITKNEIQRYIRSTDYWANEVAMQAICYTLKIYIAPIKKYTVNGSNTKLKAFFGRPTTIKDICSNKILFLYYRDNHYELIRFKYFKNIIQQKGAIKSSKTITTWNTVFDLNGIPPPLHILILIYASDYVNIPLEQRNNYGVFKNYMESINSSVNKNIENPEFVNQFDNQFPTINESKYKTIIQKLERKNDEQKGGQPAYKPPLYYGYYPPYRYPSNFIKKPEERGATKIAYNITIDMEVYPGTSLTQDQINNAKCISGYNAIRKAYSEFVGIPYVIPPIYKQNIYVTNANKSTKIDKKIVNNTRKIGASSSPPIVGGKRNITIKRR